jgi:peptide subunit release factor 1 (eRF1)
VIHKQNIDQLASRSLSYEPPMLSLYVAAGAEQRVRSAAAILLQIKSALDELPEVPDALVEELLHALEQDIPAARTLAIFATEDEIDVFPVDVELPIVDTRTGRAEAHWGEPYLTPLLAVLDQGQRYGVVFVDRDQWRCFEVVRSTIQEIEHEVRPQSPSEFDDIQESKQEQPEYVPSRGGAARDLAQRHVEELSRRFYNEMANRLQAMVASRSWESLIVLGPARDVARFKSALPPSLIQLIDATLPSLSYPDGTLQQVYDHVAPTIEELEDRRQTQLLDEIQERGITGLDVCLMELQRGRVHTVAVPWSLDPTLYRESHTGFVATTEQAARTFRPEGDVRAAPLRDVLPRLAREYNARVEFVHGPHRDRLIRDFGGMGALPRW